MGLKGKTYEEAWEKEEAQKQKELRRLKAIQRHKEGKFNPPENCKTCKCFMSKIKEHDCQKIKDKQKIAKLKNPTRYWLGKKRPNISKIMKVHKKELFQNKENHPNWQGGISFEEYPKEFGKKLKIKIRKRDRNRCQECFRHQNELKEKLSIHHIDYNKKNNIENNLISLCRSCHMQTNYGRQDWVTYFQQRIVESI